jgi:hypothetical protein
MKTFRQYISESSDKNTHLEHLEDEIFNSGVEGIRRSLNFLRGLRKMLSGSSSSSMNVTVKWDGAPAIVCGTNPENNKFFVATKSAFNKTPKLNYTHADIDRNHSGGLAETLKIALDNLSQLNISGILQGDLLFTKGKLKAVSYGGEKLIAFTPNAITYAVPAESDLAQHLLGANMGIVFHTTYLGNTISDLKAKFGADISGLRHTSRVWVTDANFRDTSGASTLTKAETDSVTEILSEIGSLFRQMDSQSVSTIVSDPQMVSYIKAYINSKVKVGEGVSGTKKYAAGLISFVTDKFQVEIDALKTDRGKQGKTEKLKSAVSFIKTHREQLIIMFTIAALMTSVKGILLAKLKRVNSIGTFLETPDGFKVTSPEGFVAVDHIGNAVKLVDRLEFSRANFTMDKGW